MVGPPVGRLEGPVTVQDEVVEHRHQPGDHVGDVVVDPGAVHAERVHDQVDDEADAPDQAESNQLEPVFRPAHAVQQADVRPDLDDGGGSRIGAG